MDSPKSEHQFPAGAKSCVLTVSQELYEPMWEHLYSALQSRGQTIRSIWIADVASQGQSGVLNEAKLGNDRKSRSDFSNMGKVLLKFLAK